MLAGGSWFCTAAAAAAAGGAGQWEAGSPGWELYSRSRQAGWVGSAGWLVGPVEGGVLAIRYSAFATGHKFLNCHQGNI